MRLFLLVTTACALFLTKLRWPKEKGFHDKEEILFISIGIEQLTN